MLPELFPLRFFKIIHTRTLSMIKGLENGRSWPEGSKWVCLSPTDHQAGGDQRERSLPSVDCNCKPQAFYF